MTYKKIFLSTALILCYFKCMLNASELESQTFDQNAIDSDQMSDSPVSADVLIEWAKIVAAQKIEAAKIEAAAKIKASENYGLEAAKIWAPIIGTALCIFASTKLFSLLSR